MPSPPQGGQIGILPVPAGLGGSLASANIPTPAHWWKFSEGSGTAAADSAGSINLLATAGAVWTTLLGVPAVTTTASQGFFSTSTDPAQWIGGNVPFTVSVWINANNATVSGVSQSVITTIGGANGQELFIDGQGTMYMFFNGGYPTAASVFSWAGLTNGIHNLVFTIDGTYSSGGTLAYIDGVAKPLNNVSPANYTGTPSPFGGDGTFSIGVRPTVIQPFNGDLTDVRIWGSALSSTQVSSLFSSGPQ